MVGRGTLVSVDYSECLPGPPASHVHLTPEIASLCRSLNIQDGAPEELDKQAEELAELSKIAEDWSHYARALVWLHRGAEAVPILEQQLAKHAGDVGLLRSLINAYVDAGAIDLAHKCLDHAIRVNPRDGYLMYQKANFLARTGHGDEALTACDTAIALDPSLGPIVAIRKARLYLERDDYNRMHDILEPFANEKRAMPDILVDYGVSLAGLSKHKEALAFYDKAIDRFPHYIGGWANKGVLLSWLGKYDDALVALNRALSLRSSDGMLLHYRCIALLRTGQYRLAIETACAEDLTHGIFHELLDLFNTHPKQQGKLQQALQHIRHADESEAWQKAFLGGLIEFTSFVAAELRGKKDHADLERWNLALQELFGDEVPYSTVLNLFDVLTRARVLDDPKALLELPLEQRQLLNEGGSEQTPKGEKAAIH